MNDWVNCPICGEPDMRRVVDDDDNSLIECVNHACPSNVLKPIKPEVKIEYTTVELWKLFDHWVKDYKTPIARYDFYIDTQKQVVVFRLYVD